MIQDLVSDTHETDIWHLSQSERQRDKKISFKNSAVRMTSIQNKCLQIMSDIYHAISISMLKTEIFISSFDLYLNARLTQFWFRHKKSDMKNLVKNMCLKICNKLQKKNIIDSNNQCRLRVKSEFNEQKHD